MQATTLALVGGAHIHTPGFVKRLQARSDVRVRKVWDHEPARAQHWAAELGAETAASADAIWGDAEIAAVIICSETDRHESLTKAAAQAGKHMFVEKPLGLGGADAYRMAKAIEEAGVLFQTGYFQRGLPAHQFIRQQIRQGAFGQVTRLRMSNCHAAALEDWFTPEWTWMTDPAQAGSGAFGDLGTHALDIMMWMLGPARRVTGSVHTALGRYEDCDEYGEALIEFDNGAVGSLAAGWVDVANPITLVISGTEGYAYVRRGEVFFTSKVVDGADGELPWRDLPAARPHAFELFLDAVAGTQDVALVAAREAADRSAAMEAIYQGAQAGAWIKPQYETN